MNENKKLEEWISGLSAETTKDLQKTLEAVIPIGEVYSSMPLSMSREPIETFKFEERGISEVKALAVLEAFRWQTHSTQIAVEDGRIFLTLEVIELLKYAQQLITKKFENNEPIRTDLERGIISINGTGVNISVGGRETYPLALLKTLMKKPNAYWFNDQIWEDWEGEHYDIIRKRKDISPNRIYNAARDLNSKLDKAEIHKFLEFDMTKCRINPIYLGSF